ncbi:hypothetical protein ACODYM_29470 [Burkholderia gladioli]|uniref:hypothetical protein n=1 Tax=Burkholderia gladioli TaxID=28095 RepID=UPI003B50F66F
MSKPLMGKPRGRDVLADLAGAQDVISESPGAQPQQQDRTDLPPVRAEVAPAAPLPERQPLVPDLSPKTEPPPVPALPEHGRLDLNAIRAMKRRKEPTIQTNARLPISLIDDIELIRSLTGTTATEIIVDGTRREVERLKKAYKLE